MQLTSFAMWYIMKRMKTKKDLVGEWIDRQYLDWQLRQGGSRTFEQFSNFLGVSPPTLSRYRKRLRLPDPEHLAILGGKLGFEIYDLMGEPRPDDRLSAIIQNWGKLTEERKRLLLEVADIHVEQLQPESAHSQVGQPK